MYHDVREAVQHALRVNKEGVCRHPRPKVINVNDVYPNSAKKYMPSCTILHQCGDDTGCCRQDGLTCTAKHTRELQLYFYVSHSLLYLYVSHSLLYLYVSHSLLYLYVSHSLLYLYVSHSLLYLYVSHSLLYFYVSHSLLYLYVSHSLQYLYVSHSLQYLYVSHSLQYLYVTPEVSHFPPSCLGDLLSHPIV
uniref:Platelet-derived growth factor (PDGF) family profile domain-containing protein n=1 Tax=Timema bartmani TaxID=61472 RepID=A0A7R9HZT2_9NEOP|nr:unnamed protein product [Timema bartmani]